jgi:hypothetical protein
VLERVNAVHLRENYSVFQIKITTGRVQGDSPWNPTSSAGGDEKDCSWRPAPAKCSQDPILISKKLGMVVPAIIPRVAVQI